MPVNTCETITEYNVPMLSARCQWNHQKKKGNTFECSFASFHKANKPIILFQGALKQAHINGALSRALKCNPYPKSTGLTEAVRRLVSFVALFFLTSLDQSRHSESLFYRLYFSALQCQELLVIHLIEENTGMVFPKVVSAYCTLPPQKTSSINMSVSERQK